MRYLTVCSGIDAPSVAFAPLGFEPVGFSEIEPFPCAVLNHRFPTVKNYGDMTRYEEWDVGPFQWLVGGTPCQSFSVAGLRKGMADPRGNLALVFLGIADKFRPAGLVWENVPGVLSSNGGRDFGAFIGALGELGYGWAYRVLDAQFVRVDGFGRAVPQRRRRVFVVGCLGDWRRAASILFERESLSGNPAPRREARARIAASLTVGANQTSGFRGDFVEASTGDVAHYLNAGGMGRQDYETETVIAIDMRQASRGEKFTNNRTDGGPTGVGVGKDGDPAFTVSERGQAVAMRSAVRRLTPRECERLQGFPDDWTNVPFNGKPASDSARYRAIGNSMAVNVLRWIGTRIKTVGGSNPDD